MKYLILLSGFFLLSCAATQSTSAPKTSIDETAEFAKLMEQDKIGKEQRVAEAVNLLLNSSTTDTKAAVKFHNTTNCDIILRIFGSKDYLLPVPKNDKNFVILDKGYYNMKYYVCQDVNTEHLNIEDSKEYTISVKK